MNWKQWKTVRTRRRHLPAQGIPRDEVTLASRSRKGCRACGNSGWIFIIPNHRDNNRNRRMRTLKYGGVGQIMSSPMCFAIRSKSESW